MSLDSGSSPRSSQASDDLHHRDNFELGMPVSTGLTSPSKRQKSSAGYGRNASAGSVFNSTDAASAGISQGVQRIQNSRCISLETVGGRASHRASSAISEHTQEEERRRDSYRLLDTVKTLRPSISHRNHSLPLMSDASSDTHTANEALPTVPYDRQSRHSTALQIISGNHSDPFQIRRRSRELVLDACEQKWDQKLAPPPSKPVSALKGASGRSRYHRRQNCVRISALAPVVYGINARSSMSEKSEAAEPGLLSQPRTPSPGNSPSRSPTRPPSVMDFCPQISPARPGTSHADFAVMPSPTQPSSSFCPSPISDNETVIPWTPQSNFNRLSTGSSIFSTPPRADLSRPNTPIPNFPLPASSSPSPRPSTTTTLRTVRPLSTALFPPPTFPAPVPPQLTRPRRQSTLHGPRSPPPRTSPAKEIRRSILALRRMNSDVSDWESTSRTSSKRYLSLGAAPESWEVSGLREVVEESEDMGPSKPLPGNAVRVDGSDATATALAKLVAEKEVGGEMAFELPVLRVGKRRERNSVHGEELYDAGGFLRE
ncbi:MAG: hypothetical protein M1833_001801 [Piccolia ochrophora]|nr:MAG: hypothetical protein M1833_001801 [Piccolia ochrophora]